MSTITIRPIQQADLEPIKGILALYWPEQDLRDRFMQRLTGVVNHDFEIAQSNFVCLVAQDNGAVVGLLGFRKAPDHMREHATDDRVAEIYLLAAKTKFTGIGRVLVEESLEMMRQAAYQEVVLYAGETHQDSYGFYEHLMFTNAGPMAAPNGEKGVVWKMFL